VPSDVARSGGWPAKAAQQQQIRPRAGPAGGRDGLTLNSRAAALQVIAPLATAAEAQC